jgi:hypothetical protein
MRKILLVLLFFGLLNELKAQGIVTFKENIFNNNRFKIDGQAATAAEVAKLMANFESSQRNFVEGHKQMRIGSGVMILGTGILLGGLINFGVSNGTQDDLNTYILLTGIGAGVGVIGGGIRGKGKKRVETAVSEYNYLKGRGDINQFSFQVSPGKFGLVLNF